MAVVDVAKAWSGKPLTITSEVSGPNEKPMTFHLGESVGSVRSPVRCFKSTKAACLAKGLEYGVLPRYASRQLLLLRVTTAGAGRDCVTEMGSCLYCTRATPVAILPLPATNAALAQPRDIPWIPSGVGDDQHA